MDVPFCTGRVCANNGALSVVVLLMVWSGLVPILYCFINTDVDFNWGERLPRATYAFVTKQKILSSCFIVRINDLPVLLLLDYKKIDIWNYSQMFLPY